MSSFKENGGDDPAETPLHISLNTEKPISDALHTRPLPFRIVITFCLCFSWICLGLYSELLGPCLPKLIFQTKSNYQKMGQALSVRAFGYFCGSVFGGYLSDRFHAHRTLIMPLSLVLAGISNMLITICFSVPALIIVLYIAGISHGIVTTSGNPLLSSVWMEKSAGPFNLMHAGYGVGAAIAPLLMDHFIRHDAANSSSPKANISIVESQAISFGLNGICAICFLAVYAHGRCQPVGHQRTNRLERPAVCSRSISIRGLLERVKSVALRWFEETDCRNPLILVLLGLVYVNIVANERVFGKFVVSYAMESRLSFSAHEAFVLQTLYWVAFCAGRVAVFALSWRLPIWALFVGQCVGTLASAAGLVWAPAHHRSFLALSVFFGLFKSPLFPTALGVIGELCPVTGLLTLIVNVGSSIGAVASQSVAGYLIETHGQWTFTWTVFVTSVLLLIFGLVYTLLVQRQRRKLMPSKVFAEQIEDEIRLAAISRSQETIG